MSITGRSLEIIDLDRSSAKCLCRKQISHPRKSTIVKEVLHHKEIHMCQFGLARTLISRLLERQFVAPKHLGE